jgi:hypothetical protein
MEAYYTEVANYMKAFINLIEKKDKLLTELAETNSKWQATDEDDHANFGRLKSKLDGLTFRINGITEDIASLSAVLKVHSPSEMEKISKLHK